MSESNPQKPKNSAAESESCCATVGIVCSKTEGKIYCIEKSVTHKLYLEAKQFRKDYPLIAGFLQDIVKPYPDGMKNAQDVCVVYVHHTDFRNLMLINPKIWELGIEEILKYETDKYETDKDA